MAQITHYKVLVHRKTKTPPSVRGHWKTAIALLIKPVHRQSLHQEE
jgi:hypothetical protein